MTLHILLAQGLKEVTMENPKTMEEQFEILIIIFQVTVSQLFKLSINDLSSKFTMHCGKIGTFPIE